MATRPYYFGIIPVGQVLAHSAAEMERLRRCRSRVCPRWPLSLLVRYRDE